MKEMYFGVNMFNEEKQKKYILQVKRKNDGTWSLPQKVSFTGFSESEPILSSDNSKLFFQFYQIQRNGNYMTFGM